MSSAGSSRASALEFAAEIGVEELVLWTDAASGLRAVVAIHDTTFGPGVGGTRMRLYPSFDDAVVDALRLARAMTAKACLARMPYGGAKAVLFADPERDKSPRLLEAFARRVATIEGRFLTGGDMGIAGDDVHFMSRFSRAFHQTPADAAVETAELAALGVFVSIREVARRDGRELADLTVALQGVGELGGRLAGMLARAGARLFVADTARERAERVAAATGARLVDPEAILATPCDVLSPNAGGGVLSDSTIATLSCRAIVGGANNPLDSEAVGDELHRRGIVYAPDYLVNSGGLLSLLFETGALDLAGVRARVEALGGELGRLLDRAESESRPPFRIAADLVAERLAAARARG